MTEALLETLAAAGDRDASRLRPALVAAEKMVRRWTPAAVREAAVADLHATLHRVGGATLAGGDPQALEDTLIAASPETPLAEATLRHAWLAFTDALARTGDKPPFGGSGAAEAWAFTARSRPWPYVGHDPALDRVLALFGAGVHVVTVRGPGRSSFLAALRRRLLAAHGVDAMVPPVGSAARDDVGGALRPYLARAILDPQLKQALPQLQLGEDLIGVFGRAGEGGPVALLLDDGHLQSRSHLLGLPLFVEPAAKRAALLVMAAPAAEHDGPLSEIVADAREREILTEIELPAWDAAFAEALLSATHETVPDAWPALLADAVRGERDAIRIAAARAWLADLDADRLRAGFDVSACLPAHVGAQRVLALAALEGQDFHAFAVGEVLGRDADMIEDLLHDDEFELDGAVVGACEAAVPTGNLLWSNLPDGLQPVFRFGDPRLAPALVETLEEEDRAQRAGALRDALLRGYGPAGIWQVADRVWRLDQMAKPQRHVARLLVGTQNPQRIEMGFRRMLPILQTETPYRLALARLYGTAMEFGAVAAGTGKVQFADQAYQAAAAAAQRLERPGPAGESLARLAEIRLALALPGPAIQALDVAEPLLKTAKHGRSLARVVLLRAEASLLEGDLPRAQALLRAGIEQLRAAGDQGHAALGLVRLGRVLYERGELDAGVAALDEAVRLADGTGDPRPAAAARLARAFVHAEQDQLDPAFALLNEAAAAFQKVGMPVHVVEVAAADLQRRHGNAEAAQQRLAKVADAFKQAGAAVQWADAQHGIARCRLDRERFAEAGTALLEVVEIRKRARDRFALVRAFIDLGAALRGQGDPVNAFRTLHQARRFAERLGMVRWLGRVDADLAMLRSEVDASADVNTAQLAVEAMAAADELEAVWAGGAAGPASTEVH